MEKIRKISQGAAADPAQILSQLCDAFGNSQPALALAAPR
jgi:hypothetical protein